MLYKGYTGPKEVHWLHIDFNFRKTPYRDFLRMYSELKPHGGEGVNDNMTWTWSYSSEKKTIEKFNQICEVFSKYNAKFDKVRK